jgi:ParB family transcriptional regulator, chromosome partitioning protein
MAKRLSGLGRGLDALFPSDLRPEEIVNGAKIQGVSEIDVAHIKPMKSQPRTLFDEEKIEQLSYSIKEHGVLQPIVLVERSGGHYEIIAGERRFRAASLAGLKTIPAVVRSVSDLQQLEMALVENIQREDLGSIDQAVSIRRLHEDFSQSYEVIAKKLGKAESTVVNLARLLNLPQDLQNALTAGLISEGHARSLLALNDEPEVQKKLYGLITIEHWSVRRAELFVKTHKESAGKVKLQSKKMQEQNDTTKALEKRWGRQVRIQRTAKGGKLTIAFKGDDDLESLLKSL